MKAKGERSDQVQPTKSQELVVLTRTTIIAAVFSFVFLLVLIWLVFVSQNYEADYFVFDQLEPAIRPPGIRIMKVITFLGTHRFLIPANLMLILYLLVKGRQKAALLVLTVALSSWGLMGLLKNSFQRLRPDAPLVQGITNYSFPSGHALMSVAFFGLLMGMAGEYFPQKKMQQVYISFMVLLILCIGFSRIYLRVHYPTDVLAGYCIGISWLFAVSAIFYYLHEKLLGRQA